MSIKKNIVISVGGSLIVPNQIDANFLSSLKKTIINQITDQGYRFVLVAGGGKTARLYQAAAREVSRLDPEDIDWLGLHATRLNAHLLRTIFRDQAHPIIITNPDDVIDVPDSVNLIIAAGYRPGSSTDLRAIQIANHISAGAVINLSNTDYVFTADPNVDPEAEKIEDTIWSEFRKLIPDKWDPGMSAPFDPIAAKAAEESGVEVACLNGNNLDHLNSYLAGKPFVGTRIHN